ncbi:MAG: phosphate butyryltransferase, partial [Planctomycetia bacterium]|nr:phosphate butyryltransferase [Planctomycetia bacterium]
RGWVTPILAGRVAEIERLANDGTWPLDGFHLIDTEEPAVAAVAEVSAGRAQLLMKGQIATPALMKAILHADAGLRTRRTIGQIVLMEIAAQQRRFLLADTGITIRPTLEQKADLLQSCAEVAWRLGAAPPRIALMAASESINAAMPETVEAAELQGRAEAGVFPGCDVQGPLSFDLAYAPDAGDKKRIAGAVTGQADVLLFPDLLSANLTVKAIMYTAECRFGGVLWGARCPVVFMSRADTVATRLHSLAFALRVLDGK